MTNGTPSPKKHNTLSTELKRIKKDLDSTSLMLENLNYLIHGKNVKRTQIKSKNPINASGLIGQTLTARKMDSLPAFNYRAQSTYKFVGREQVALMKKSARFDFVVTSIATGKTIHFEVKHQNSGGTVAKSILESVRIHKCIKKHVFLVVSGQFYSDIEINKTNDAFLENDDNEATFAYMVHLDKLEKLLGYWEKQNETDLLELAVLMKN